MTKQETIEALTAISDQLAVIYHKTFPNGAFIPSVAQLGGDSILITTLMIGNKSDQTSGITHNDPARQNLALELGPKGYVLSSFNGGSLSVKPPKDSYLAMSKVKFGFRKMQGNEQAILRSYARYVTKMAKVIKDNKSDMYRTDIPSKYFPH